MTVEPNVILYARGHDKRIEVHDERIPDELFGEFTARMPECCVEVVVEIDDGVLLARRTNEPTKGEWFWPGGRLYKGEPLKSAARRIAAEELGIDVDVHELLGVYSHVWESSAVEGNPSRHTVNTVFRVSPSGHDFEITLDDQHDDYRILTEPDGDLHEYVRRYVEDGDLFGSLETE